METHMVQVVVAEYKDGVALSDIIQQFEGHKLFLSLAEEDSPHSIELVYYRPETEEEKRTRQKREAENYVYNAFHPITQTINGVWHDREMMFALYKEELSKLIEEAPECREHAITYFSKNLRQFSAADNISDLVS